MSNQRALPLHVPDEPVRLKAAWLAGARAGDGGANVGKIIDGEDGIAAWLWQRWRVLSLMGVTPKEFTEMVIGYRRELWLWLAGERTWNQAISGLLGRVERRCPIP